VLDLGGGDLVGIHARGSRLRMRRREQGCGPWAVAAQRLIGSWPRGNLRAVEGADDACA
jgi:hypothetical protein